MSAVRKGRNEMNIGDVIKYKRQKMKMSQAELAEKLNVTPQAVSRWEMGVSYPDIAMVPLLSEVLWASADELLGIIPAHKVLEAEESGQKLRVEDVSRIMASRKDWEDQDPALNHWEDQDPVLNQSQADSIFDYVPAPVSGECKNVLVVDDANFMRMMLEDILTHSGHTVLQARDGQEGLNTLLEKPVDVCVLDINMPGMDGLEVLKRIKAGRSETKVVMLSAMAQERNVRLALQLGADAFVVKPFQAECLLERIG